MSNDPNPLAASAAGELNLRAQLTRLRSDQEHLFNELRAGENRLRLLARSVWRVEEEERRRVARDLHDGVGQNLTALRHRIESITESAAGHCDAAQVAQALSLCDAALSETRNLARLLRPTVLDDLGLQAAINWLARTCGESISCEPTVDFQVDEARLDSELSTVVFRLVQEALNNVARHSAASHVSVRVATRGPFVTLLIADDGCGFDMSNAKASALSSGLSGMRERVSLLGGAFNMTTSPGAGVQIRAQLPFASAMQG